MDKIEDEIDNLEEKDQEKKDIPIVSSSEADMLFIDAKKTEMLNIIDSGELKAEEQKYGLVDAFVLDVMFKHPSKEVFVQYLKDQKEIKEKINALTQQFIPLSSKQQKLYNQYKDNAKEMLEQIRKL